MLRLLLVTALLAHGSRHPPREAPADGPSVGPGYALAAPVLLRASVDEETPVPELMRLGSVPGITLRVVPHGNMLGPEVLAVMRRIPAPSLGLSAPLLKAHVEQLQKLEGVPVEVDLGANPDAATLARLGQLGPRRLELRVDAAASLPPWVAKLPRVPVIASFGRRAPKAEELAALALRKDAVVELPADSDPAAVKACVDAGLALRVVADDDRIPSAVLAELVRATRPIEVELSGMAAPSDASRLAGIPALRTLSFRFDRRPLLPADSAARLSRMRPPPLASP